MSFVLILKILGAIGALGLGIWVGLGLPGLEHGRRTTRRASLDRTWMNRVFFKAPDKPRRFDGGRLITPEEREEPGARISRD